jgi:peptide/nickel transport system substrate-binding protein
MALQTVTSSPDQIVGGIQVSQEIDRPLARSIVDQQAGALGGLVHGLQTGRVSRRAFIHRAALLGVSLASIEAIIAACGSGSQSTGTSTATGPPKRGGTLKAAFSADPAGFDPQRGPSGMSHVVIEQVYSTLMALNPEAVPQPELAESHEVSSDGLAYTFKLRPGVKFHNGDDLTAEDVKFSFDRLLAPNSGYSYTSQIETIKKIEAVDPLTVRFTLSQRTGPFLVYMAFPGSSIVPKKLVQSGHDLNAKPIGSGPFQFVSYEPRSAIKFTRNQNYFEKGKPYFDAMEYRLIGDITALTTAVESGQVNFSNEIPPKDWRRIKRSKDLTTQTLEGSRFNWLVPNNSHKPFDNVRIRQAISYALDRQALVDGAFFGQATPITGGVIPKWNWGYAPDTKLAPVKGDVAKAKSMLAQAGFPNGFTTSMTIVSSFPQQIAMAPIIQANLEKVGIKAKIGTMEVPRYWDEVWSTSNFDITTMYWLSPLADPDDFVTNNYSSTAAVNVQKYASKKMDDLLAQAKSAPTQDARKDLYKQMQQLSMDDMPIVPLVNGWLLIAYSNKLQNYKPMRTGFLKTLKDAWFA